MEEKELKTSTKQRVVISLIAIIMVGAFIASYAAIIVGGTKSMNSAEESAITEEKRFEYQLAYEEKQKEFREQTAEDFAVFSPYITEISAYNEVAANSDGVKTRDLKEGTGRELEDEDADYLAYYVGWCADETIFDSTLDDDKKPTMMKSALDASVGMIEGWNTGVVGMKLGGVREITIAGELAYGETMEICGGFNKPLKFIMMPVERTEALLNLSEELKLADLKVKYANYGIDYDKLMMAQ